jgi:inorganic pyrophosphatase
MSMSLLVKSPTELNLKSFLSKNLRARRKTRAGSLLDLLEVSPHVATPERCTPATPVGFMHFVDDSAMDAKPVGFMQYPLKKRYYHSGEF